jgi:predicted TIM-barrel fold metal-dependent hydrolase
MARSNHTRQWPAAFREAGGMTVLVDCDQHLYESRTLWRDHVDPADRELALVIEDDELGYAWLRFQGRPLEVADVQVPHDTTALGDHRNRYRQGLPASYSYDEALPDDYWSPAARVERTRAMGFDEAVVFPNFGLGWERPLSDSLPALKANMTAWNRWCSAVVADSGGALHPVAHLTLRDPVWLDEQLRALAAGGVRLAMIAPALVDGRPLSHTDHDRIWRSFVHHGVTPVFHVANQPRVFDDAWYTDHDDSFVPVLDSVFIWTPPALALTDLILNGVFDRHPELRVAVIELGSIWVPMYLLMLDGGSDFTARLNGRPVTELAHRPSQYVRDHVRIASFSYELPKRLIRDAGDLFMACSDYPHSEGTDTPISDYASVGCGGTDAAGLLGGNIRELLA